jgi:hypothetical protein
MTRKEGKMRVSVYKGDDGRVSVLVEAAVGHKKPPVLLSNILPEDISKELPAVLDYQRGPKEAASG